MMKVLHIMSGFGGGISSFIKNKATALKESTIVFDVLTYDPIDDSFETAISEMGGVIHYMENPKEHGFKQFYNEVNDVLKKQPSDVIVHCHIQGYRMLPFYFIAKKNKVKRFIVHAHTDADKVHYKKFENRLNRLLNSTISVERASCGVKASLNIFGERPVEKKEIMHIPNSIEPTLFLQSIDIEQKKREVLGEKQSKKFLIGNIARFHRQKNHLFMVDVIEELSKKDVDFLWLFIGDGALQSDIEQAIRDKGLNDYVRFLGRRNDAPSLYHIMDIFALPSLYEGLPTVAIEAQAAGTRTFMSDTITQESDLEMGLVHFLPIDDAKIWAEAITQNREKIEVDTTTRKQQLQKKKFSNEISAQLYSDYLLNKRTHYEI